MTMLLNKRHFLLGAASLLGGCSSYVSSYIESRTFVPTKGLVKPADWVSHQPQIIQCVTADGNSVEGWYFAPANKKALTIAFFQGNGGHAGTVSKGLEPLLTLGHGLFVLGYRGYGNNPGKPSEAGLINDTLAQLARLEALGVSPSDTVLFGHSLGGALATIVARRLQDSNKPYRALVTAGAVPSIADMAPAMASGFIKDRFDAVAAIKNLKGIKVFVEGMQDAVVPPSIAVKLMNAADIPPAAAILLRGEEHHINLQTTLPVYQKIFDAIQMGNLGLLKELNSPKVKVQLVLG